MEICAIYKRTIVNALDTLRNVNFLDIAPVEAERLDLIRALWHAKCIFVLLLAE